MSDRIIAIGDIHGCSVALEKLLESISLTKNDIFVSLGDVVDRGDNSRAAIDALLRVKEQCEFYLILGNHEEMMLEVVKGEVPPHEWLKHGGVSTLDSYGFAGDVSVIPDEHIELLSNALPFWESENHFFTHGNYDPKLPFEEQTGGKLRWTSLIESTPGPHISGKKAVVGHTPDQTGEIFDIGHLMCIDTYCYGGQWLTAVDVVSGKVWQANEEGELRSS